MRGGNQWVDKDPNEQIDWWTEPRDALSFKQFDKYMGSSRANPFGCGRERREFIFGNVGWKFDFSGAWGILMKNRGGRPRKNNGTT